MAESSVGLCLTRVACRRVSDQHGVELGRHVSYGCVACRRMSDQHCGELVRPMSYGFRV